MSCMYAGGRSTADFVGRPNRIDNSNAMRNRLRKALKLKEEEDGEGGGFLSPRAFQTPNAQIPAMPEGSERPGN